MKPENIQDSVFLASYTSLKIGGLAKHFVVVKTEDELDGVCGWAKKESVNTFVLGGGSNILISDKGFDGLVIVVDIKGRDYKTDSSGQVLATIGAGENWDDFVNETVKKNYAGVECLSGIPGKVGASAVGNIGAYGQEVSEIISEVKFYDTSKKCFETYSKEQCEFSYRDSVFKKSKDNIVTAVTFRLKEGGEPSLKYKELAEKFVDQKSTLTQVREAVLKLRASKSMLLDNNDPNSVSAGSFFKNPLVNNAVFEGIKERHEEVPNWSQPDGQVKLSAGWLIEKSGFSKGYICKNGKVGLSQKHALAIINRGGANANDVVEFSKAIQEKVQSSFSVKLEPEVVFVGFD